jgi:hypothetical protein
MKKGPAFRRPFSLATRNLDQPRSARERRVLVVVVLVSAGAGLLLVVDVVVEVELEGMLLLEVPALLVVPVADGYGVVPATVGAALPLSVGAAAGPLVVAVPPDGVAPRPVPVVPALLVVLLGAVLGMAVLLAVLVSAGAVVVVVVLVLLLGIVGDVVAP